MSELIVIEGCIEEIIYSNFANGYTVCVLNCDGEMVTATGCMPYLAEGEEVSLTGGWVEHPEYGRQFSVKGIEKKLPSTTGSILRYLASGVVRGIRLATAKKIVDKFGEDTLNVILTEPAKLAEVKGISREKAILIGEDYAKQQGMQSIIMFLQSYGIGSVLAMKVYKTFGAEAVSLIKKNPYILSDEIEGISFKTADRIAMSLGGSKESKDRVKSGIVYILMYNAVSVGHTYLPKDEFLRLASEALEVDIALVESALAELVLSKRLYVGNPNGETGVFLSSMALAESKIADKISKLLEERELISESKVCEFLEDWEKNHDIKLAEEQKNAVFMAAKMGVFVLTGGPGTGKTTIVNAIIDLFEELELKIALAAPTGRAAKRLSEVTNREAKTIHRLLEVGYGSDDEIKKFVKDESNPLDYQVFIVDEASMIDINLGYALMCAIRDNSRVIFVGDCDQLPPVGAGNMLSDIISSKVVPVSRLSVIFRQAACSSIVRNAHRVMAGDLPLVNEKDTDFFFLARDGGQEIADTVCDLCSRRIPEAYKQDPMVNIQVLTPSKKGMIGTVNLNIVLQKVLNPPSPNKNEYKSGAVVFREGDKVMQTKNNYDIMWESVSGCGDGCGVFNGDIGFVEAIDNEARAVYVIFDDKRVVYTHSMLEELEHSYAITVHKSQGSEFDTVIMPVFNVAPMLMRRNLFYTAITRAKKLVILVGNGEALERMVNNDSNSVRYTALKYIMENGSI